MKRWLVRILKVLGGIIAVLVVVAIALVTYVQVAWNRPYGRPVPQLTAPTDKETVARGEYLFKYGNQCWGCHSLGTADANSAPVGGREFDLRKIGPGFGIFYSPNITPDPDTGIGKWSDGAIVRALREGLDHEGRLFFPIMPADWYKGLSDSDALAIAAYLKSIPPVRNAVPANKPSMMTKVLFAFKVVGPQPAITQPVVAPPAGATVEYGQYLASHASGCAECHTPRDLQTGKAFMDQIFAGSNFPFGGPMEGLPAAAHAPNLTPDQETGIGGWSEEQFVAALRTGMKPDGSVMLGMMPYAYYGFWKEDDLRAVYRYLRTVPVQKNRVPAVEYMPEIASGSGATRGEALFKVYCAACHGENGKGAAPTTVALAQAAGSLDDAALQGFIANGLPGTRMPAFGKTLSQEQIADLIAFVRTWRK